MKHSAPIVFRGCRPLQRTHPVEAPVEAAPGFNGLPGGEAWLDRHIGWMRRGVKAASSGTARRRSGPIRMQSMRSSSIEAAGYDRDRQTLRIRYVRGSTYDYVAVPARVFRDFLEADSKGRFVNWSIKPFYRYTRVS